MFLKMFGVNDIICTFINLNQSSLIQSNIAHGFYVVFPTPKSPKFVPEVVKMTKKLTFFPLLLELPTDHWSSAESICLNILTCRLHHWLDLELLFDLLMDFLSFSSSEVAKSCDQSSQNGKKIYFLALNSPNKIALTPFHPWKAPNSPDKITLTPFHLWRALKS